MKLRRFLSAVTALLLVCGMPVSVFAAEYDLAAGSVTVTATADGQTVTHGDNAAVQDDAPVIIQTNNETPTTNTITIKAEENITANVTIQDVNIVISDTGDHSGEAAVTIDVADGAEANVTLDGVNIDVGRTGCLPDKDIIPGEAAVQITGNGDVTLELDGANTVQSGLSRAGVEKNTIAPTDTDPGSGNGKLTITDKNGTDGSLKTTGGDGGSGIGGGYGGSGSNITITGSAEVTATGGANGSGIGGGMDGSGSDITITGSAEVTAQGGIFGSGIGGGNYGSGSAITISGSAEVTAKGGLSSSGIGGGRESTGSFIEVSGDAQVKAQGGESKVYSNSARGAGAAIGNGGAYQFGTTDADSLKGQEVTPDTAALNEGWIATYTPGTTGLDTATPDSLTYQDNGQLTTSSNAVPIAKQEPTCTETGHEAGFMIDGVLVAVTIPATEHNVPNGTPHNDATCTTLGTMTGYCTNCKTTVTVTDPNSKLKDHTFTTYTPDPDHPATCTKDGTKTAVCDVCKNATDTLPDPAKNHSFTNYISDNNATYDADGTKTAKCDHCDATDTIPAPGTRLPFYKVKGQDGAQLLCEEEKQDGVLTITVDADCASLTGTLGGIKALKARGVDTIVFVTKGATSTFAIEDLLAQGASGDTYSLTHDGSTVTFTLGNGTDMSKILK